MAEESVWVYAVGDAQLAGCGEVTAVRGLGDTPVRVVVDGGLGAVVGAVDAEVFGEESLRRLLEDLRWLEDTARAHDAVVSTLARIRPVAPVRMATIFLDDAGVRALLREHAAGFTAVLDRIRGRVEWGVKAYAPRRAADPAQPADGAGPGTSYLLRRRAERDSAARARQGSMDAAEVAHRRFAAVAVAARRYPPQDPRLAGHHDEMVLNAAYLVDEAAAAALRDAVDGAGSADLRLELTGPWAPYSFATLDGT